MIEICVIGNSLLTRIEHNADTPASVKTVVLYNHGFPDSAVTPHALAEFSAVKGTGAIPITQDLFLSGHGVLTQGYCSQIPLFQSMGFGQAAFPARSASTC